LLNLDREIKDTDKLIANRFRWHPQAHSIESLPGVGPLLGAQFIVATGGDVRAAFANAGRLASYAGLMPVPRGSGRVSGSYRRTRCCNRPLRQVFFMATLSSIRADGESRRSVSANEPRTGSILRPYWLWRVAWSTCCGPAARQPGLLPGSAVPGHNACRLTWSLRFPRADHRYLRRRGIKAVIPEKTDQPANREKPRLPR